MYEVIRTQMMASLIRSFDATTTQEVMRIIDRIMIDYDISRKETALALRDNSLIESIQLYILCAKAKGMSDGAIQNAWFALRKFASKIGKPIKEITTNDVRAYLLRYQIENKITSSSLEKIRQRLNCFFQWAVDEELIDRNPCHKIPKIISQPSARHAISEEQLEYCRLVCKDLREKALLEVFFSTGARLAEIARLNRDEIDWYEHKIRVFGKGSVWYIVYLNTKAAIALKNYLAHRTDNNPALFVTARGAQKLSATGIRRILEDIGKRANLDVVLSPHVLRHTMATTALRNGASLESVQHMLNHKSPATTQIYAKMDTTRIASEHKRTII